MANKSHDNLRRAMIDAHNGQRTEPRALFRETVLSNPDNYQAWLWLAYTAANANEKRAALYKALCLKPDNDKVHLEFQRMLTPQRIQSAAKKGTFVCYSRSDEVFAIELAEKIKERKLSVWIDMLDIAADEDWRESVNNALEQTGILLLILSPDMVNGKDNRDELEYALGNGKVVLPVMHKTCDPTPLNLMHPIIDMRQNYNTGLRLIFTLLGINQQQSSV